jgi:hypothetical protein
VQLAAENVAGLNVAIARDNALQGKLERVKGIEPSYSAWKAAALPLSYTRIALSAPAFLA